MHILFTTPGFPPFVGGGERHVGALAGGLAALGNRVTVVTSGAKEEADFWQGRSGAVNIEEPEQRLTVVRAPLRPIPGGFRGLLAWRKSMVALSAIPGTRAILMRMAERVPSLYMLDQALGQVSAPADIVHGFNISWEHTLMAGWRYAQAHSIPFVASPLAHLGLGPNDRVALNSTMRHQQYMLSSANLLLTNTAIEAQGLAERGVHAERVVVAGPGVDTPARVAALPNEVQAFKPYALFIGRANYDKGAMHAVEAIGRLNERGIDIDLVLIGRETEAFRRFVDRLSAAEQARIHRLGVVDESLKHAYLRDAAMLLLPSRADSFGIVLLEAWHHGRPVVAANSGGIPEVVDDGENGLLVPFGEVDSLAAAIERLVADQGLNRLLGANGRQKLQANYTWEIITARVLEAYQSVLQTRQAHIHNPGA